MGLGKESINKAQIRTIIPEKPRTYQKGIILFWFVGTGL